VVRGPDVAQWSRAWKACPGTQFSREREARPRVPRASLASLSWSAQLRLVAAGLPVQPGRVNLLG